MKKKFAWTPPKIEPAKPFVAHSFNTIVDTVIPTVYMTPDVVGDIFCLVDECETEIGWLGIVEQKNDGALLIKEIFVPKQECHATTTKFDKDGIMDVYTEIMKRPNGADLVNQLRFWGHSHVMFDTIPSPQDEDQMEDFRKNKCDYFIRGIFNKLGSARFDVFDYQKNIAMLDVPWAICPEIGIPSKTKAKNLIRSKVKEVKYQYKPSKSAFGGGAHQYEQGFSHGRSWDD